MTLLRGGRVGAAAARARRGGRRVISECHARRIQLMVIAWVGVDLDIRPKHLMLMDSNTSLLLAPVEAIMHELVNMCVCMCACI